MNKRMKYYTSVWLVALAIFNVIAFAVPDIDPSVSKFTVSFWIGYTAVTIAFIGQLICALISLKEENQQKLFYKISLISVSYTGLIVMLVAGALCMAIPALPYWVGIVISVLVLGFTAISIIKASATIDEVEQIDVKVKEQTSFIRSLTADADGVVSTAKSVDIKQQVKKIYEALRYADPVSNPALSEVESQIADVFNEFATAASAENAEKAAKLADELLLLIRRRNRKCKLLK